MKFNAIFYIISWQSVSGADPGFQVRGAHLKKLRRAEGGAKMFGVFRVKNPSAHHPPPPESAPESGGGIGGGNPSTQCY